MSFQIHNKEGIAIPIKQLDEEAAKFWNKEVHPKQYANPTPPFNNPDKLEGKALDSAELKHEFSQLGNWFDIIGYQIHSPSTKYTSGWGNVKASMWVIQAASFYNETPEEIKQSIESILLYFKPYFALIDYWDNKGYVPVKLNE